MPGFNSFRVTPSGAEFDYVAPQPPPKNAPDAKPIWPAIIAETEQRIIQLEHAGLVATIARAKAERLMVADMQARHEFGVAKYGVPLAAHNDRDHLSDAYQEFLDAIVYLRAEIEKRGGLPKSFAKDKQSATLVRMYSQTIENAAALRAIFAERDGR